MPKSLLVGADVGGTNIKYVVQEHGGERVAQGDVATDPRDARASIRRLRDAIAHDLADARGGIDAVGLACAGIVDPESGQLGRSPNLPGWEEVNLVGELTTAFGELGTGNLANGALATAVANDVNAAAYGEFCHGAGRGVRHLVMIALGTGVGGGVIVDGNLLTGHGHGAGEIGHMTLALDGPLCPCGNHGCLEAYCGSNGLVRRARELAGDKASTAAFREWVGRRGHDLTTKDLFEVAESGDTTAVALFHAAGRRLGQAVASLVNVLAPERVIIGGGVAQAGDLLLAPCREMVARHVMAPSGRTTPVLLADLGSYAAAMGAAALAVERGTSA